MNWQRRLGMKSYEELEKETKRLRLLHLENSLPGGLIVLERN
jgi:hypothetical protein